MSIVDVYKDHFGSNRDFEDADLLLIKYNEAVYIGKSNNNETVVVVKSSNPEQGQLVRRTALISIECNMHVTYKLNGKPEEDVMHVVKCFSDEIKEIELFLETAMLLIGNNTATKDDIVATFQILASFFEDKSEPSDNELFGLYAELFTIKEFNEEIKIGEYWQTRDKLKFDFSISDKVKVEVKSTTKPMRVHHFRHDQLSTSIYEIYILSYLLRRDDEGLSLLELIKCCKPIIERNTNRLVKVNKVLKNVDHSRLASIRFEEELTRQNLKIFNGEDAPKFTERRPEGVANAEYDCNFESAPTVERKEFIKRILEVQNEAVF